MKWLLLSLGLLLAPVSAFAQGAVQSTSGCSSPCPVTSGGTGQITAAAALAAAGLDAQSATFPGDAAYPILATDNWVVTSTTFTGSHAWTLPAASSVNAGKTIYVSDNGNHLGGFTLTVPRTGGDTINATATTYTLAFRWTVGFTSDGVSNWAVTPIVSYAAAAGTLLSAATAAGMPGQVADVAVGSVLTSGGVGVLPAYATSLPTGFVVGQANGGTGTTSYSGANVVDNGGMLVDQRNEGASLTLTGNQFSADRWRGTFTVSTSGAGNPAIQQQAISSLPTGTAFVKSLIITASSTPASSTPAALNLRIRQVIEGPSIADFGLGTANAITFTVSGWLKTSLSGTSSWGIGLQNGAANRSYPHICTTVSAAAWAFCSFTVPGDTTGTWLTGINGVGMIINITAGSGSNFQGTADTWTATNSQTTSAQTFLESNASATLETVGWKVERGTVATPYVEDQTAVLAQKVDRCFQKTFLQGTAPVQNVASVVNALTTKNPIALGDPSLYWTFSPVMSTMSAAIPTITTYNPSAGNANWRDVTASSDVTVSVDPATSKGPNGVLIGTSGTVATLGDVLAIHATADGGC